MFSTILDIVNKFIPDQDEANKAALRMEQEFTKQMTLKSDIIKEEARNGSGKWRVRLMYLCMGIITMHFLLYDIIPYCIVLFDLDLVTTQSPADEHLWSFLKIGVGGYIGSRGIEKSIGLFKGK